MIQTKRQDLPPGLWIVATPIGNLGDITPRALWALEKADFILCEDTRRTAVLLSALNVPQLSGRLKRLDAHTEVKRHQEWVEVLQKGGSLALVSDAGTPGVSDPGAHLVAAARDVGVRVTPFPGASAVSALLSVSGFGETSFVFRGFFPRKIKEQEQELDQMRASGLACVVVWFESPLRILSSLEVIRNKLPHGEMVVGKELTKIHEHLFYGAAEAVFEQVHQEVTSEGAVGEWCFALYLQKIQDPTEKDPFSEESGGRKALNCLLEAGVSVSEAAKRVSHHFGISKNAVYEVALALSGKKNTKGG